jgi:hypothetical protein
MPRNELRKWTWTATQIQQRTGRRRDARTFKLLLRNDSSKADLDLAVERFLVFMSEFHAGTLAALRQGQLEALGTDRGLIAVTYDRATDAIVVLDPRPKHVSEAPRDPG